jgi:putative heme-binding domain-containing protein
LVAESTEPLGRLHALWTLVGLEAMTPEVLLGALSDAHPGIREHAVRISDRFVNSSPEIVAKLLGMTSDENYRVLFQLAFTLGEIKGPQRAEGLSQLAARAANDSDLRTAWLTSVTGSEAALAEKLLENSEFLKSPGAATLLTQLAVLIGARNEPSETAQFLTVALGDASLPAADQQQMAASLAEGLGRKGASISKALRDGNAKPATRAAVEGLFQSAATNANDPQKSLAERQAAIRFLSYAEFAQAAETLQAFLTPQAPQALQSAAVVALGSFGRPEAGALLIENWRSFGPTTRRDVVDVLTRSVPLLEVLLASIGDGQIKLGEIDRDKKQQLLNHPNEKIRDRSRKLLAGEVAPNRAKVLADYQAVLKLTGDAGRGQEIFKKNCAGCHQAGPLGVAVGPNLASTQNKTPADLLINILDPNREALPAYVSYTIQTDNGKILTGLVAAESATSVTLKRAEAAQDVVLRSNIEQMVSSGVSLMPEGLEKDIGAQQMADLIEFVRTIKPEAK